MDVDGTNTTFVECLNAACEGAACGDRYTGSPTVLLLSFAFVRVLTVLPSFSPGIEDGEKMGVGHLAKLARRACL